MCTRHIQHSDGPSHDLNVDDIWSTLVRETRHVRQETAKLMKEDDSLSLYRGPIGAMLFSRTVSSFIELGPPRDQIGQADLKANLTRIDELCLPALSDKLGRAKWYPKSPSKYSFLETPVGAATEFLVHCLAPQSDAGFAKDSWPACINILRRGLDLISKESDHNDDDGCEVLYGRAGFLYALLRLREVNQGQKARGAASGLQEEITREVESIVTDACLAKIVRSIIDRGHFGASMYASNLSSTAAAPALMWSWHHKRYLGAAHGVAGILHVLLLCPMGIISAYMAHILQTIEWLIGCHDKEGNWPSSLKNPRPEHNDLVQWCHGAPGMIILLATVVHRARIHPQNIPLSEDFRHRITSTIQRSGALVYSHGFLRKGIGLCHGVAGSVYALLAASDAMGTLNHYEYARIHFLTAIHLAYLARDYVDLTSRREMDVPDRPWSLYEGAAGMCSAWAEVYDRLGTTGRNLERQFSWCRSRSGMPGFDDIDVAGI